MAIVIKTYSQRKNNNFSYKAGQCNNDWAQNNRNQTFMKVIIIMWQLARGKTPSVELSS